MILKVYADESMSFDRQTKEQKFFVVSGFIASQEDWTKFTEEWRAVLDGEKYKVPNFHFRIFSAKANYSDPSSPYYNWDDQKRDDFFYDLAMVAGNRLIPLGGAPKALEGNYSQEALVNFFTDVRDALNEHWPNLSEGDFTGKVLFIFDQNNKTWEDTINKVLDALRLQDKRFGEWLPQDDEDPKHLGLQAADFLAAIHCQVADEAKKSASLQKHRIIDLILYNNLRPKTHEWNIFRNLHPVAFKLQMNAFRMHERQQKQKWKMQGLKNKIYYPFEHYPLYTRIPCSN